MKKTGLQRPGANEGRKLKKAKPGRQSALIIITSILILWIMSAAFFSNISGKSFIAVLLMEIPIVVGFFMLLSYKAKGKVKKPVTDKGRISKSSVHNRKISNYGQTGKSGDGKKLRTYKIDEASSYEEEYGSYHRTGKRLYRPLKKNYNWIITDSKKSKLKTEDRIGGRKEELTHKKFVPYRSPFVSTVSTGQNINQGYVQNGSASSATAGGEKAEAPERINKVEEAGEVALDVKDNIGATNGTDSPNNMSSEEKADKLSAMDIMDDIDSMIDAGNAEDTVCMEYMDDVCLSGDVGYDESSENKGDVESDETGYPGDEGFEKDSQYVDDVVFEKDRRDAGYAEDAELEKDIEYLGHVVGSELEKDVEYAGYAGDAEFEEGKEKTIYAGDEEFAESFGDTGHTEYLEHVKNMEHAEDVENGKSIGNVKDMTATGRVISIRQKKDLCNMNGTESVEFDEGIGAGVDMDLYNGKAAEETAACAVDKDEISVFGEKDGFLKETEENRLIKKSCQDWAEYTLPPLDLLESSQVKADENMDLSQVENNAKKLVETLASFGVGAKVVNISKGPAVTRYELQPNVGVKVSKIVNLADDIALNLAATGVRIEAPIPGKAAVGIEVPNKEVRPVFLREVIESQEFINHPSKLSFAVGKDIAGKPVVADIARMPHLLIAGATGSGKSVCINTLIASILYKADPSEVKLLMVDPKVVELSIYNGIPHLLIPVVTDPKKAAGALNWAVTEMLSRYKLFADNNVRDLKGYNALLASKGERVLPQVVIIIDELADLMMVAPNEVEDSICRLAQMARAAGMHLVIATQRPSVDVITGVIKANIPSRISFAVSSQIDSRTILDMSGAEKLLGRGDMLFSPISAPKPVRVQGAFISDREVESIVSYIKSRYDATQCYDEEIIQKIESQTENHAQSDAGDEDELLNQAIEIVIEQGHASTSFIQRKLRVGYARAARILDQMEAWGIVGPSEGSKPRQLKITKQEWQEMNS